MLRGHDRAIVGLEKIDEAVLAQVPELRVISKYGVGLDGLDLEAMARRGVKLAWTGGVNRRSVSRADAGVCDRAPASRARNRRGAACGQLRDRWSAGS